MWNIKIRCPEKEDSGYDPAVALKYLDINKDHLIVREKGKVWHWHVHGTPLPKYEEHHRKVSMILNQEHPDREGSAAARPVTIKTGCDEQGFQYCLKNGRKAIRCKGIFSDDEIDEMIKKSKEYRADKTSGSRKRAADTDISGLDYVPAAAKIMRSILDHSEAEGKLLPMQARQIVLTDLYSRGFKDQVIKSMLKL